MGWLDGTSPSCSHPRNVLGVQRKIPVSTDSRVSRGGEERDEGRRTKEEEEDDDDDDDNDEEEEKRAWLRSRCQLPLINEILCTLTSLSPLHVETRPSTCREAINLDATGVSTMFNKTSCAGGLDPDEGNLRNKSGIPSVARPKHFEQLTHSLTHPFSSPTDEYFSPTPLVSLTTNTYTRSDFIVHLFAYSLWSGTTALRTSESRFPFATE